MSEARRRGHAFTTWQASVTTSSMPGQQEDKELFVRLGLESSILFYSVSTGMAYAGLCVSFEYRINLGSIKEKQGE